MKWAGCAVGNDDGENPTKSVGYFVRLDQTINNDEWTDCFVDRQMSFELGWWPAFISQIRVDRFGNSNQNFHYVSGNWNNDIIDCTVEIFDEQIFKVC